MKILSILVLFATLTSCASRRPKPYSNETHCSPEALLHLKNYPVTPGKEKFNEAVNNQSRACYREEFISEEFAICSVVQTDQKGKISYLDIEDQTSKIPEGLHKCLTNAIEAGDYSSFPDSTIIEPIFFHVKRRE